MQCQHAGRPQNQLVGFELGLHQCQAWHLALGDKLTRAIDHHPSPVKIQAGVCQQCLRQAHASAGFDWVDQQVLNTRQQIALGKFNSIQGMASFLLARVLFCPAFYN